ncbi:MAG: histidine kinase dimerization/phosphoacceptor domain -containing protein [bacterium]
MIRWTLRLRLVLAFCTLASLILFVGLASYLIHATTREDFRQMRTGSTYDLATHNMETTGLEIEGRWDPAGHFLAKDIQPQPALDPRLRGPIQALDPEAQTLRMYGIDVSIPEDTANGDEELEPISFEALAVGQRVEVKCKVREGEWIARKLYTQDVKSSDKVKGMVTSKEMGGDTTLSLFIHDLRIVTGFRLETGPQSTLARVEEGGRMLVQLQACRSAAFALASRTAGSETVPEAALNAAMDELITATAQYGKMLGRSPDAESGAPAGENPGFRAHLRQLSAGYDALNEHLARLITLVGRPEDQHLIRPYIQEKFSPFLETEIAPRLTTYLWEAEEELGDQLREILKRAEWTPRLALGVSALGMVAAVLLGWLLWRSIHTPLQRLQDAAIKIGGGHLDTRIAIQHDDELGVLSQAFNRMASDLASTTVSMTSMETVLDSMASGLFVLDAQNQIVRVNRAACLMTGYTRDELLGQSFELLCGRPEEGEPNLMESLFAEPHSPDSPAPGIEHDCTRKDGSTFPVTVSGAELGLEGEAEQGVVCVAQDLTEQKRIQQGIRDSLAEKELLLREVHHRVKNNMQVISSLLAIQAQEGDPEIAARLEVSQNRVRTIALIHEHLYLSAELAHIDLHGYLSVLIQHLLHTFGRSHNVDVQFDIQDLGLDIDEALSVGLIANELVTNSLKYAFPEGEPGTIRIQTTKDSKGACTLLVADDGCGYAQEDAGRSNSLGSTLIGAFAKKLKGEVRVTSDEGTTTLIEFTPNPGNPEGGAF